MSYSRAAYLRSRENRSPPALSKTDGSVDGTAVPGTRPRAASTKSLMPVLVSQDSKVSEMESGNGKNWKEMAFKVNLFFFLFSIQLL